MVCTKYYTKEEKKKKLDGMSKNYLKRMIINVHPKMGRLHFIFLQSELPSLRAPILNASSISDMYAGTNGSKYLRKWNVLIFINAPIFAQWRGSFYRNISERLRDDGLGELGPSISHLANFAIVSLEARIVLISGHVGIQHTIQASS